MTSNVSLALRRRGESTVYLGVQTDAAFPRYHPAPSRNEVAVVQPVLVRFAKTQSYCVSKRICPDQTTRRRPHDRRALPPTRATDGHQTRACQAMDPTPGDTSTPCERPVSCTRRHNGRHRHAWVTMDARNLLHIYCFVCVGLDM